jgi:hypothetical protein
MREVEEEGEGRRPTLRFVVLDQQMFYCFGCC